MSPGGQQSGGGSRQASLSGELPSPQPASRISGDLEGARGEGARVASASRPAGPSGKPAVRSADEIKAAYGRPTKKCVICAQEVCDLTLSVGAAARICRVLRFFGPQDGAVMSLYPCFLASPEML